MVMELPFSGTIVSGPSGKKSVRLLNPLGSGAFGVVFKAVDINTKDHYAVKFPQSAFFGGQSEMTAFMNEVQAAQKIQHPNVVRILYVETKIAELPPYLIMEFVEGGTLKSYIEHLQTSGEFLSGERLQVLAKGLIDGIASINEKMLHRDLKPDNILLDGNIPKIADFGLAKIIEAATRSKTFKGRQHIWYMAPEGWKLESNDIQIDMYSMGIILYELSSLEYPYQVPEDASDYEAFRDMHFYQQPKPLKDTRSELPIGFCNVVAKLMEKRHQDRFSDWAEVKQALDKTWEHSGLEQSQELIDVLINETATLHQKKTTERLASEKMIADQLENKKLDEYQLEKLVKTLIAKVDEFNQQSVLGEIKVEKVQLGDFPGIDFSLPFSEQLRLCFSQIDPPLNLSVGQVRFAAFLVKINDRNNFGVNYLLCRNSAEDIYGKWVACLTRQNPIVNRKPRPEPFAFTGSDIVEIERADHVAHIYEVEFVEDLEGAFLNVALAVMRQKNT